METNTNTTPVAATFETLLWRISHTEDFRPLARAAERLRRAAAELDENLTQMRKQAEQMQYQATSGNCFLQTTIGSALFYDPTEYAHRASVSGLAQNQSIAMIHEIGNMLGVEEAMLHELIAYICANATDWKFQISYS